MAANWVNVAIIVSIASSIRYGTALITLVDIRPHFAFYRNLASNGELTASVPGRFASTRTAPAVELLLFCFAAILPVNGATLNVNINKMWSGVWGRPQTMLKAQWRLAIMRLQAAGSRLNGSACMHDGELNRSLSNKQSRNCFTYSAPVWLFNLLGDHIAHCVQYDFFSLIQQEP